MHKALVEAGRKDLIGSGPQCLIPSNPPKVALTSRRDAANGRGPRRGDPTYVHAKDAGTKSRGGLPCNTSPYDDDDDGEDD